MSIEKDTYILRNMICSPFVQLLGLSTAGLSKHVNAVGRIFGPARGEMGQNMKILKKISKKIQKNFWKIFEIFLKKFAKNEKIL